MALPKVEKIPQASGTITTNQNKSITNQCDLFILQTP